MHVAIKPTTSNKRQHQSFNLSWLLFFVFFISQEKTLMYSLWTCVSIYKLSCVLSFSNAESLYMYVFLNSCALGFFFYRIKKVRALLVPAQGKLHKTTKRMTKITDTEPNTMKQPLIKAIRISVKRCRPIEGKACRPRAAPHFTVKIRDRRSVISAVCSRRVSVTLSIIGEEKNQFGSDSVFSQADFVHGNRKLREGRNIFAGREREK